MAERIECKKYPISRGGYLHYAAVQRVFGRGVNRQVRYVLYFVDGTHSAETKWEKISRFRKLIERGRELEAELTTNRSQHADAT